MIVGMEVVTLGPRPRPRQWATALTSYSELNGPEFEPDERDIKRWLNGVKFIPFGCERIVGKTFDPCVVRDSTNDMMEFPDEVQFYPFLAEVGVRCSTLGLPVETLEEYAIAHTEIGRSSILGAQVERSAYQTANASLASEAQDLTNADTSLMGALHAIEVGLADILDGGMGMIHMPAGLLAILQADGGLHFDDDHRPYTATGHLIVADAGYLGASPATQDVVAGEIWMYGSGPVFAKYDDVYRFKTDDGDHLSNALLTNKNEIKVETYGIALFEPCSVVAAVVDTSDNSIEN